MAEDEEAATTLEGDSYPSPKVTPSYTEEEEVAATPEGGDSYPSPKVTPSYTEEERDSYPYSTPSYPKATTIVDIGYPSPTTPPSYPEATTTEDDGYYPK